MITNLPNNKGVTMLWRRSQTFSIFLPVTKKLFHIGFNSRPVKTLAIFLESCESTQMARSHNIVRGSDNFRDQRRRNNLLKTGWTLIIGLKFSTKNVTFKAQNAQRVVQLSSKTRQSLKTVVLWSNVLIYPTTDSFEQLIGFWCQSKRTEWFIFNEILLTRYSVCLFYYLHEKQTFP